jgi:hypothetical protein
MKRRAFIKGIGLIAGALYASPRIAFEKVAQFTGMIKKGDVFTIQGVYAVNGKLQEFVVVNEASGNLDELYITPPIK